MLCLRASSQEDYVMIKGACPGVKRRVITLRKTLFPQTKRSALEVGSPRRLASGGEGGRCTVVSVRQLVHCFAAACICSQSRSSHLCFPPVFCLQDIKLKFIDTR
jgi:hypothetical protein